MPTSGQEVKTWCQHCIAMNFTSYVCALCSAVINVQCYIVQCSYNVTTYSAVTMFQRAVQLQCYIVQCSYNVTACSAVTMAILWRGNATIWPSDHNGHTTCMYTYVCIYAYTQGIYGQIQTPIICFNSIGVGDCS